MSLPVWVPGLVKYGICDRQHQNFDRAFVAMFGLTFVHFGGVKMWQARLSMGLKPITARTPSLNVLCEFVFQVFFFTVDMCSAGAAARLLLLTCSITVMLVAPPCTGQGKVT